MINEDRRLKSSEKKNVDIECKSSKKIRKNENNKGRKGDKEKKEINNVQNVNLRSQNETLRENKKK